MESAYQVDDSVVALATPRGRGAIAVIRASGPGCIESFSVLFSRPRVLIESEGNRVHYGWIVDGDGRRVDEVLVTVFRAPASYTGQDSVEISCHGGPAVVDRILLLCRGAGFRDAAPGEFTFRAFSLGKMDLTRAEAVKEIIDARTDRARALAASRLAGSVTAAIDAAKDVVKRQAAVAALALDYPEDEAEEVPFDPGAVRDAAASLGELIRSWRTGRLYRDGLKVTLVGPANAGKSSLFNLFLREERSIVTERPGTTRDWLEAWLNLDGMPLLLVDTAGLRRDAEDPIEAEGMRRTRELIASSDLVVAVADGSLGAGAARMLEEEELSVLAGGRTGRSGFDDDTGQAGPGTFAPGNAGGGGDPSSGGAAMESEPPAERLIRVWNKADLAPEAPRGWIPVSAVSGAGFADLEEAIRSRALHGGVPPEGDAPVIDSARQKALLERAADAMIRFADGAGAGDGAPGGVSADLLAEDLRDALDALGELTGAVSRADVLETLFSEFCVGK